MDVTALVCDRLANVGDYVLAGELLLSVNMMKEALDMFMAGEVWEKARDIARNIAPRYEKYVEDSYVEYLKEQNKPEEVCCNSCVCVCVYLFNTYTHDLIIMHFRKKKCQQEKHPKLDDVELKIPKRVHSNYTCKHTHTHTHQMSNVDPGGALKMYSQSGQWDKCIELAEKQGEETLAKYVALYAAELIKSNAPLSALQLFNKYGAPANPQVSPGSHAHTVT